MEVENLLFVKESSLPTGHAIHFHVSESECISQRPGKIGEDQPRSSDARIEANVSAAPVASATGLMTGRPACVKRLRASQRPWVFQELSLLQMIGNES